MPDELWHWLISVAFKQMSTGMEDWEPKPNSLYTYRTWVEFGYIHLISPIHINSLWEMAP